MKNKRVVHKEGGSQEKPLGTRRQKQKAETRALILSTARSLFEEKGFESTTLREIAAQAGVGLGTIFGHVPDKGALLIEALLDDLKEVEERAMATLPLQASPGDQMLHIFALVYEYWARRPELSRVLIRKMWFVDGSGGDRFRCEVDSLLVKMTGGLMLAQQQGIMRSDISAQLAAKSIYAFYTFSLIQELAKPELDVPAMLAELREYINHLFTGIGPSQSG